MLIERIRGFRKFLNEISHLPCITIDLMCGATAGHDPFLGRVTREFYREATRRHPKFPLVRRLEYGFAVYPTAGGFDAYFARIDGSARRNYKKSLRLGYGFARIDYNSHLDEVTEILRSVDVRQGRPMPREFFEEKASPTTNPTTASTLHDYPYFGIFKDGKLLAFAACLVAGELCSIQTIFGHAQCQSDGLVPMLIISILGQVLRDYPNVKFYAYGTYYGSSPTMKRFKKKFQFLPHRVVWNLGENR